MSSSIVNVTDMAHSRAFPINGEPLTVRMVVADFLGVDRATLDVSTKTLRLVNYGAVTNELERPLVHNDTITIFNNEVANGGIKGAARC